MKTKGRDNFSVDNDDCLSKMPTATAEQLNIAKMLSKPNDDVDLRSYVAQLQELTKCTEDQAVTALYDCENNLDRAVELLLDKFRCGCVEEWRTTGKKTKSKSVVGDITATMDSRLDKGRANEESRKGVAHSGGDFNEVHQTDLIKGGRTEMGRKENRNNRVVVSTKNSGAVNSNRRNGTPMSATDQLSAPDLTESNKGKMKAVFDNDGWDPFTEYGEWTGEAIEVINSNASIEEWCPEQVSLPPELFVDTEHNTAKDSIPDNQPTTSPSINTAVSPNLSDLPAADSLFISKAHSKPPPRAFTHLPDVPVFIVPDILPRCTSRWVFKFGGEALSPVKSDSTLPPCMQSIKETASHAPSSAGLTQGRFTNTHPDPDPQDYSSYSPPPRSKSPAGGFDVNKSTTPRSLLDDHTRSEAKPERVPSTFTSNHFQATAPVPKTTTAFSSGSKNQISGTYESETGGNQANFLEPTFKNYLLDGLSNDVNKLAVGESTNSGVKASQFNVQQSVSQATQSQSSFNHPSGSVAAMSNQVGKTQLSHMSVHGGLHSSQQNVVSTASQSQQPSVTLPPGMHHFISQFAPPPYHMFNLPGSSSNTAPLFDLDQLQLIHQQQRMLYDMHLQHHAATTAQSLLPSAADSSATSKQSTHNVAGSIGHVTATNPTIRPDMLASAIGHAPQMLAPGHPYFSYPGLVFMNGYSNAFLNQQQQQQQQTGQDTTQPQSSAHCGSPITQSQGQSSGQPQSFSGLKQVNTGVGAYDDLLDMKYGDPSKQVGFKNSSNQPNYGSFQGTNPADSVGPKLSNPHQTSTGPLTQGNFNATGTAAHTHFPPQFYPPAATSPYMAAAAVAVAAAAAASVQQQQASVSGNPSVANANQSNTGGGSNASNQGSGTSAGAGNASSTSGQLHLTGNPTQPLVLGTTGGGLHHRHHRPVIPH